MAYKKPRDASLEVHAAPVLYTGLA